jgi:hypothetical protein
MLTGVRVLTVLLIIAGVSLGQTAKKASATPVKASTAPRTAAKASPVKAQPYRASAVPKGNYRGQAPKATSVQATRYSRMPARRAVYSPPRPAVQMQPSQDRYREIQQALIDKGYLQGEATGAWDATSVTALNRFKQDQNQKADGRLDSRSLIALGLGPKKDSYISVPGALAAEQAIGSQDQQ